MIGHFKLAKKITFILPHYSSMPITFNNVYYDRFNSIFKGFYFLIPEESTTDGQLNNTPIVRFKKLRSTERFGEQDIVDIIRVDENILTEEQKSVIKYLNYCINNNKFQFVE